MYDPQAWLHSGERKEAFQLGKDIIELNDKDGKCPFVKKLKRR